MMKSAEGASSMSPLGSYTRRPCDGQHGYPEDSSGAEQFARERDQQQHQRVTEPVADAVEECQPRRVLHRVALARPMTMQFVMMSPTKTESSSESSKR